MTSEININYLIQASQETPVAYQPNFFNQFFNQLAGNSTLQDHIINNVSEHEIRAGWQEGIDSFLLIRERYLLYD